MANILDYIGLGHFLDKIKTLFVTDVGVNGNSLTYTKDGVTSNITVPYANVGGGVLFGTVDVNSPNVAMTATVPGLTELKDGVVVYIANNIVSASTGSWTLNINNLGAKPVHNSKTLTKIASSEFAKGKAFLLIYNSTLVSGGCWVFYIGDYSDSDSLAYIMRTAGESFIVKETLYHGVLCFTYSDTEILPSAREFNIADNKQLTTLDFNPFGRIYYYNNTYTINLGDSVGGVYLYYQQGIDFRRAFNMGSTLVADKAIYLKCQPLTNNEGKRTGRVKFAEGQPIVQLLPSTEDGFVYIFLGTAISEKNIQFVIYHPIYEYKEGAIRLWTNQEEHLALTSEEIDSDIIEIVEFKDPIFKLTLILRWNKEIPSVNGEFPKVTLDTLTTIPSGFMAGSNITSIEDLENFTSLTSLNSGEFSGCQYLTSITIPDNIQSLGSGVFALSSVSSVTFGGNLEAINGNTFTLCLSLTTLSFPSSLKTLDLGAFANCTNLTSVTLNEGLLTIGNATFYNTGITAIIIPSTVTTIYYLAISTSTVIVDFGNTRTSIVPYSSPWGSTVPNLTAIIVPDNLVNDWKSTVGWSSIASYIVGYSEYHNN